jgi:hypothetical protein
MRAPSTLRLPFWAATRFRLEAILASQALGVRLREVFALGGHELAFARALLTRRRNLWLYRTNQRHACGDFVAIDMSAPRDRRAYALELKSDEPVRLDAGGVQLAGLDAAIAELRPVIGAGDVITARGGAAAVLAWLAPQR